VAEVKRKNKITVISNFRCFVPPKNYFKDYEEKFKRCSKSGNFDFLSVILLYLGDEVSEIPGFF
jgi:hypothetical protein